MCKGLTRLGDALAAVFVLLARPQARGRNLFDVPLENGAFTKGVDDRGVPLVWAKFSSGGKDQELRVIEIHGHLSARRSIGRAQPQTQTSASEDRLTWTIAPL
jgi:hypothetical protein